ncbi:hypothetical protein JCM19238_3231 [Vibrio ponticus]|nr:hypothetical protein JCM19238_3231 [Vibrio ponticus]
MDKAEERQYRAAIKAISAQFFSQVMQLNTLLFSEVKSQDETIIQSFYQQMCHLVTDTINSQPVDPQKAFDFLVGNCNFDKVIVCRDHVQVMQFSHIAKPQSLQAKQTSANHIQLDFDNGFSFDMRLHTASSKFALGKTINQKFDTRLISDSVQSFTL